MKEVLNYQEVTGKTHLGYHGQFKIETLAVFCVGGTPSFTCAFIGKEAENR